MNRLFVLLLSIISLLLLTACSSKCCTCGCQTTQSATDETLNCNMQQEIEDSCENPIGDSHYPYIVSFPLGDVGSVSLSTAEHGTIFNQEKGKGAVDGFHCFLSADSANEHPIVIDSNGHEIIVTLAYDETLKSFTLNEGERQLLSIPRNDSKNREVYVYVIVT